MEKISSQLLEILVCPLSKGELELDEKGFLDIYENFPRCLQQTATFLNQVVIDFLINSEKQARRLPQAKDEKTSIEQTETIKKESSYLVFLDDICLFIRSRKHWVNNSSLDLFN